MNAVTDSIVVNSAMMTGSYEPTFYPGLSLGDITEAGLERVESRRKMYEVGDATRSVLMAAAGMKDERIEAAPQTEKEKRRAKWLSFARKTLAPETLFPQLCHGAALRTIDTNTAAWIAQQTVNAVCDLAVNEIIRRRQQNGLIKGFNMTRDEREVWIGAEATDTDDMGEPVQDNRETTNVFSVIDDVETILATFQNWYDEIETPLAALALSAIMPNNGIMRHGQFSKWVEHEQLINGVSHKTYEQVILSIEERLADRSMVANDRQVIPQLQPNAQIWLDAAAQ